MKMQGITRKINGIPHFLGIRKMVEGCRLFCDVICIAVLAE